MIFFPADIWGKKKLGVDGFNPFAICRKTHGVTAADRIWFKFQGEEISFEDVRWK